MEAILGLESLETEHHLSDQPPLKDTQTETEIEEITLHHSSYPSKR
jgi:hypothetical protein